MGNHNRNAEVKKTLSVIGKWLYNLRSIPLAIPVVALTVFFAVRGMAVLPDEMIFGDFVISKSTAVMGPVAVTAASLLMLFCSKRVIYPWLISLFTLLLPICLQLAGMFLG